MARQEINFTKAAIDNLRAPAPGARLEVYDTKTQHLRVRVSHTGRKVFEVYRWHQGRPTRIKIGVWPDLSIEQVRKAAEKLNADFAAGEDPAESRRQRRQEMTFAELFDQYMERHAKQRKITWQEDQNQFDRYLGGIANKKLSTITRKTIADLHGKIGKTAPTAANRLLALLSSVFGRAIEFGLWEGNNPCVAIRKFPEEARDRFLSKDELRRFFEVLEHYSHDIARDTILVALLTGVRRSNVHEMKWADIDWEEATWRIGWTKNGTPQTVALVEPVVELLRERHRRATSVFVFPGRGRTGHYVEVKTAWKTLLKRAGIENARFHDLRRTMGSWQARTGASLPIIGKSLNHKSQSTTAIYARLDLDPARSAMEKAVDAMLATRDLPEKVIPFRRVAGDE